MYTVTTTCSSHQLHYVNTAAVLIVRSGKTVFTVGSSKQETQETGSLPLDTLGTKF